MPKLSNDTKEDRDQQILRRLSNLEHKVDSIDQTNAFALRADAERHFNTVREIFGKSVRAVQVYLAANGERSVKGIADLLGMKSPNVTRELKTLQGEGLLEISENIGGEVFYGKKPIDKTIRISLILQKEFNLTNDGLPTEHNVS